MAKATGLRNAEKTKTTEATAAFKEASGFVRIPDRRQPPSLGCQLGRGCTHLGSWAGVLPGKMQVRYMAPAVEVAYYHYGIVPVLPQSGLAVAAPSSKNLRGHLYMIRANSRLAMG